MKHLALIFAVLASASLPAAVPLRWTVETSRAAPAQFEAYQGETLAFEAALQSYGKPLEAPSDYSLYWQTNGMGNAYWSAPCPSSATTTNVIFATWSPTNDVGARVYTCFIGKPGTIYHAAFQLRLRPSPGALPNELPLPQKVIDFAKVTVLNPPWSGGGGGGGVDTNAVIDIIHKTVDGAARPLPKYLHLYNADDSYPDAAAEYYRSRGDGRTDGGCSSVRDGGYLYRNFDYPFDDRAEFVVRMSAGTVPPPFSAAGASQHRFASVGVAQVGTNLTEQMVTSGKWSKWYKALPGATVDGINEHGVACNINVVDGEPHWEGGASPALHPLAAVRWILDNATNAQHAAEYISAHIAFPAGWTQNFHYMICDETSTYIVENGEAYEVPFGQPMTNYPLFSDPYDGSGSERLNVLMIAGSSITNVWYTRAYSQDTSWESDFDYNETLMETSKVLWAAKPHEQHRGERLRSSTSTSDFDYTWWQTVHTSIYDLTNRTLRVAVQETDDWYVFAVPSAGGGTDEAKVRAIASEVVAPVTSQVSSLQSSKADVDEQGFLDPKVKYIGMTEQGPLIDIDNGVINGNLEVGGDIVSYGDVASQKDTLNNLSDYVHDTLDPQVSAKADRSMISATNSTFSNEVAAVARTVTPQPSPTLRLFDPVLNRWVILKSVNMNITLEVE